MIMLIPFRRQPQQFMCKQTVLKRCNDGKREKKVIFKHWNVLLI